MNDKAKRRFPRLMLLGAAALTCLLLVTAAPAGADTTPAPGLPNEITKYLESLPTPTTTPATGVTASTAVLNGVIDTGGAAVTWYFEFGPSLSYGSTTPAQTIPAGHGKVNVSWTLIGLQPLTIYDFRLVAVADGFAGQAVGKNQGFLTAPTGFVYLRVARLKVRHRIASVPLSCASKMACRGRFTITTTPHGRRGAVVCDSSPFKLKPGRHLKFKVKLDRACRSLIEHSRHHRIKAKFTLMPSSSQFGIVDKITLTL